MHPVLFISHLVGSSVGNPLLVGLAIIVGTCILEDPTTVIVGVLAADGSISVPVALISLYLGIVIGDIGLYGLGALARTHPRLERYVDHEFVAAFRTWLESRYVLTIFTVRFIPGLRLPTYTASGFFRSPLGTFILTAIGATSIWTTLLFSASYWFGAATSEWLGWLRYAIAAVFLIVLFVAGRYNLRSFLSRKKRS